MRFLRTHKEKTILFCILLVAAFLRLYNIAAYLTFLGDEGRDVLIAKGILEGHFTLLGPRASAGDFFTGPVYYYMMVPFLWLFQNNPVGPAVMIALLSVATVWLIYVIGKKFMGQLAGFFAATLYALSPLVITYAHSSWNPDPMPFFTLLLLYLLYIAVKDRKKKYYFLCGVLYGIVLQLHYIEVFTGVIMGAFVLIGNILQKKKNEKMQLFFMTLKNYATILFGFLFGFSLFIAFEIRHQFENTKAIISFIFHGNPTSINTTHLPFWQTIFDVFSHLFGHLIYYYPTPDRFKNYDSLLLLIWLAVVLFLSIAAIYYLKFIKDKLFVLLLGLWLFFGVSLFSFYHKPIYDYYFEFMFPLPFLIYGNFLAQLYKTTRWQPYVKIASLVFLIAVCSYFLWWTPIKSTPNNQMNQMKTIAEFVIQKADNKPFNFAIISKGNSPHAYFYFFHIENHDPITVGNLLDDPERKSVTQQLFVVCETLPCQPVPNPDFPIAGFGQAKIANEWDVSVSKIYKLVHYSN